MLLACTVAVVHAMKLWNGHVGFIDDDQEIVRKIIEQRPRRAACFATTQMARVVLDPGTVAHFLEHLDIVTGALFESLCFEHSVMALQVSQMFFKLALDVLQGCLEFLLWGDEVLGRIDLDLVAFTQNLSGQRLEFDNAVDSSSPELDAGTRTRRTPERYPAYRRERETCRA